MYLLVKYLIIRLIIAAVSTGLILVIYPIITHKENLTELRSVFLIALVCSFLVHLVYILLFRYLLRKTFVLALIKVMVCFMVIPLCWIIIGSFTFGVDYKALLIIFIAISLPNVVVPFLEKTPVS